MFAQITDPEYPPASMLNRSIAFMLDIMLVIVLTTVIVSTAFPEGMEELQTRSQEAADQGKFLNLEEAMIDNPVLQKFFAMTSATSLFLMILYFALIEVFLGGATLGKKVFNLRTAYRDSPRIPPLGQLFIRSVLKTISFISVGSILFFLVGNYLIAFFRKDRRTLHDILTKTSVVPGFLPEQEEEHRQH